MTLVRSFFRVVLLSLLLLFTFKWLGCLASYCNQIIKVVLFRGRNWTVLWWTVHLVYSWELRQK